MPDYLRDIIASSVVKSFDPSALAQEHHAASLLMSSISLAHSSHLFHLFMDEMERPQLKDVDWQNSQSRMKTLAILSP
eukprot:13140275-Ditylum_brightwellii.AAC.1